MRPLEDFLDKTNLEDRILQEAAAGHDMMTAHWLRQYKDVVKMYGCEIDEATSAKQRKMARTTYFKYVDMYHTFKKEVEEILGERLQL